MAEHGEVVELPADHGYRSRSAPEVDDVDGMESPEDLPVLTLDKWLSADAEKPTKWIVLEGRGRILVQAMSQKDFKEIRRKAPMVPKGKSKKMVKDEDWIQNRVIMDHVLEPKITNPALLEHALAGDVATIVTEISRLSGFDVEGLMRDALEQ